MKHYHFRDYTYIYEKWKVFLMITNLPTTSFIHSTSYS